ncbi:MAG: polyphosphate polymerase domain-containing protein [Lawsonibacter sp.]|nr:polyphosphate polymerase domain-containing protein [Lawsonibacter sp.]
MTQYRHEWKHQIDPSDCAAVRQRLRAIACADAHAEGGQYLVRSLYFDDSFDTALREKLDGVNRREKFRLRYYNGDLSLIHLEKKSKWNGLGSKFSASLSLQEAGQLLSGRLDWMMDSGRPLVQELYHKMKSRGLRPRTIVDYTREPFVYPPGNVRVTLDYNIRTGLGSTDFLNPGRITIPLPGAPAVLEVKWDQFLPAVIQDAVQLRGRQAAAFSKYAACRVYG